MSWHLEILLYLILAAAAVLALEVRNLLAAAVVTTVFSFLCALLYISMGAVDVGFTEAVVGAAVVGVFFVALLLKTTLKSVD